MDILLEWMQQLDHLDKELQWQLVWQWPNVILAETYNRDSYQCC